MDLIATLNIRGTQHNDIKLYDIQLYDIQCNDIQHNIDTQLTILNRLKCGTKHKLKSA
jgi:hypothetical protein